MKHRSIDQMQAEEVQGTGQNGRREHMNDSQISQQEQLQGANLTPDKGENLGAADQHDEGNEAQAPSGMSLLGDLLSRLESKFAGKHAPERAIRGKPRAQAPVKVDASAPLRERVMLALEQRPLGTEKLSQAVGVKALQLRAELKEMEAEGLIDHNEEEYMLGPKWIAANPISETAREMIIKAFYRNVMAEKDLINRTGLSGETIRRAMRWMATEGIIEIRYVGLKPIYQWKGQPKGDQGSRQSSHWSTR